VVAEAEAVNGSEYGMEDRLRDLRPGGGSAVWVVPFQGISPTSLRLPVDLVFLDKDRAVIDTVESFPMAAIRPSSAQAASVLALPADSLAKAKIRLGDKLAIYPPEEMKQYLQRQRQEVASTVEPMAAAAVTGNGAPIGVTAVPPASVVVNPGKPPRQAEVKAQSALPGGRPQPWKKDAPTSWWKKLLVGEPVDPRRAAREPLPGMVAYFFTGGTPKEQPVRDMSNTGIYILTEERWFKGTIVQLTLTDRTDRTAERSITLNARAVRQGTDGVALEFIRLGDDHRGDRVLELGDYSNGVTVEMIEEFLGKFRAKSSPPQS